MKNKINRLIAIIVFVVLCLSSPEYMLGQGQIKRQRQARQDCVQISNPDGYINGHGYVDMGLPSGRKWATCNVGASEANDYGDYFAWGEITPKSTYTKDNSKTYGVPLTNISGNNDYDIASQSWRESWRIPTKEEFEELIDICKWRKIHYKGVDGHIIIGPNGKSIFLPWAGCMLDSNIDSSTGYNMGHYWTATAYKQSSKTSCPDYDDLSWFVYMNKKGPVMFYGNYMYCRGLGLSIRPISN